jgi:hypothetical protein
MNQTTPTAITPAAVKAELGKFLSLAGMLGHPLQMFSELIDAEWHRLLDDPDTYEAFCAAHDAQPLGHAETVGHGEIRWISDYCREFGDLPPVWFANSRGVVDQASYDRYRRTGAVIASWDCSPTTGGPD